MSDIPGITVATTVGAQLVDDNFTEDLLSFNPDSINDSWLNQYLPDFGLPELNTNV